jgi:succinoglycan biosynthesis protein ExoO
MDFSVIIPAYNVSGIIGRAIRSAAAQTLPPLEILVVDDCSTDNTVEVVKALGSEIPSLRLLSSLANGGPSAARNIGLRAAKGDWIALLDSDDAWKPGRLKRLSEVASTTSVDFVADNLVLWDAVADAQVKPFYYDLAARQKQITLLDMFRADDNFNFSKASYALMKPIFRRNFLVENKIEYNESMKIGEDFNLFVESLFNGAKIVLIQDSYYIYSMPRPPSGRSPHSRSVYRFDGLTEQIPILESKYQDRIDPELKRTMHNYGKTMMMLYHSDVARQYRWKGKYAKYIAYLVARPELTRRLVFRAAIKTWKNRFPLIALRPDHD